MHTQSLTHLESLIDLLSSVDPDFPLQVLRTLVQVAVYQRRGEQLNLSDLHKTTGIPYSTLARHMVQLSSGLEATKKRAYGLVSYYTDPNDARARFFVLTPAGNSFMRKLGELTNISVPDESLRAAASAI